MLMNKVSPATLCPSQDDGPVSGGEFSSQSQFSQTSYDLFSSQTLHAGQGALGKDTCSSSLHSDFSQHSSQPKQIDYFQRYLSVHKSSDSQSRSGSLSKAASQANSSASDTGQNLSQSSCLSKSRYDGWRAEVAENKGVVNSIVKVTRQCAQELEDTLKDLKQSLASHSVSQTPNPPPDLLSESALKLESANLLDNQNKNFIQLLDGQLETRKLIADLVLRFERREAQLINLESKIDLLVKKTTESFSSLHDLLDKALCGKIHCPQDESFQQVPDESAVCQTTVAKFDSVSPTVSLDLAQDSPLCDLDSGRRPNVDQLNTSPGHFLTTCTSSQSGVDIDLSQMSPSLCGKIITQCLSRGSEKHPLAKISRRNFVSKRRDEPKLRRGGGRKRFIPRTPVVTRSGGKRLRNNSESSDEEHCHVTVTMKTMDVKRSVRRSKKSTTPLKAISQNCICENSPRMGFTQKTECFVNQGDENAFSSSPTTKLSQPTIGSRTTIHSRKEEQRKRLLVNRSMVKGSEDILKELKTALVSK